MSPKIPAKPKSASGTYLSFDLIPFELRKGSLYRHRKETYSYQRENVGGRIKYKINIQQEPTV